MKWLSLKEENKEGFFRKYFLENEISISNLEEKEAEKFLKWMLKIYSTPYSPLFVLKEEDFCRLLREIKKIYFLSSFISKKQKPKILLDSFFTLIESFHLFSEEKQKDFIDSLLTFQNPALYEKFLDYLNSQKNQTMITHLSTLEPKKITFFIQEAKINIKTFFGCNPYLLLSISSSSFSSPLPSTSPSSINSTPTTVSSSSVSSSLNWKLPTFKKEINPCWNLKKEFSLSNLQSPLQITLSLFDENLIVSDKKIGEFSFFLSIPKWTSQFFKNQNIPLFSDPSKSFHSQKQIETLLSQSNNSSSPLKSPKETLPLPEASLQLSIFLENEDSEFEFD